MKTCPCGSNRPFSGCCEPYITGPKLPDTAEQLMRSRYTAYTVGNTDYITQTMRGQAAENFDPTAACQWATSVTWLGLTVIKAKEDTVTFIARFQENNQNHCIYEHSEFERFDGRWFYTAGQMPTVKRNDPCPCQSGKKAKRCCFSS